MIEITGPHVGLIVLPSDIDLVEIVEATSVLSDGPAAYNDQSRTLWKYVFGTRTMLGHEWAKERLAKDRNDRTASRIKPNDVFVELRDGSVVPMWPNATFIPCYAKK